LAAVVAIEDDLERARLIASGIPSLISCDLSGVALRDEATGGWSLAFTKDGQQVSSKETKAVISDLGTLFEEGIDHNLLSLHDKKDGSEGFGLPPSFKALEIQSLIAIPLRTVHSQYGMLVVGKKSREPFLPDEHLALQTLAEQASIATENLRLRKSLQDRSRKVEALNELILSAAGEGIYGLDAEGMTTFANPAAIEMLGYSIDELIGQPIHDLHHHTKPDGSNYPAFECPIYAAFKDAEVHRVDDEIFWRKDGTSFPVEYTSTPILENGRPVGAVVVFRDITNRKHAEEALKASEQRYRSLYKDTPVMMHSIDREGKIVSVSDHWLNVLGYKWDEVVGQKVVDFLTEESRQKAIESHIPTLIEKGAVENIEYQLSKKNGIVIDVLLSAVVERDAEGEMSRGLAVLIDVTERKLAEARVRELQSEMHHVSRLSTMGELASGLAHELNQPLTAIINYVQACRRMLKRADANQMEKIHDCMDKAVDQADRAGQIIHRLREFVSKGQTDRSLEDLNEVVKEASTLALVGASEKDVALELRLDTDLPLVLIDRIQIQQVVFNLVRNSVDALKETNGHDISIKTAQTEENTVSVEVSDAGPGLSEDIVQRLFQPFVTTKPKGMGIGLSICRSIVQEHGGRLWATPGSNGGATFHFTVPITAADEPTDD